MATALIVTSAFLPVAGAGQTNPAAGDTTKTRFAKMYPMRILQSDRLAVGKRNRICITSRGDAATMALVERSGEDIQSWTLESLVNDTAIELTEALRRAGFPVAVTGPGISGRVLLGDHPKTLAFCQSQIGTIFVSINIEPSTVAGGYRAVITARQNVRHFIAQIDRPTLIVMSMEGRAPIPFAAQLTPDRQPYWDVHHDVFALRKALIDHLFGSDR